MPSPLRAIEILLVEDNLADVELTQLAFATCPIPHRLHFAPDGVEAIAFLKSGTVSPDLILLDLNMPRMDGRETLDNIRGDNRFKNLAVFILTGGNYEKDVVKSQLRTADGYITKPINPMHVLNVIAKKIEVAC